MKKYLVYDVPTRMFHWLFAGLFITAFVIAKTIDDESGLFPLHMMAGLTLLFLICLRVIWGIVGSRHAKFSGFALNPFKLMEYFKGIASNEKQFWAGHNPASSWAAVAMLILGLGLGVSGILMTSGQKETFEDFHELVANAFIIVVASHILGILIHTLRHKDLIGLSMIDGKKTHVTEADSINAKHAWVGGALLLMVFLFASFIYTQYDASTGKLRIFGQQLVLSDVSDVEDKRESESN